MKKAGFTLCAVVLFLVPYSSRASVQITPAFMGTGVRLSFIVPQWYDVGFGLGAHADISILPVLHLYPSFEYSHAASGIVDDDYSTGAHYYKYSYLNDFAVNGDLRLYPPVGKLAISPFVGGGLAFIVSDEYYSYVNATDSHNQRHNSVNDVGLGVNMLCGLDIPIGKVIGNVELKLKLGTGYTIFKVTGGVTFPVSVSRVKKNPS